MVDCGGPCDIRMCSWPGLQVKASLALKLPNGMFMDFVFFYCLKCA